MIYSAAQERLPLSSSASSQARADPYVSGTLRVVTRWIVVALVVIAGNSYLPVAAQTVVPGIRAEFRTAPRPLITQSLDRDRLAMLPGPIRRGVATAQDLGPRDPSALMEHMQLMLQRPQERQAAFDAEVAALHRRGDPSYHQWLTPEIIGAEFGPSASDIATLTSFLQSEGFTVNNVGKSGMFVDFTGTVAQVQQSFHTEIHNVRLATGEERYSAVRDAQMPEALAPLVGGMLALSNIPPHPTYVPARPPVQAPGNPGVQFNAAPDDTSGSSYYLGAQDFYTIYNEKTLLSGGITGAGTTVALLEETDINTADVTSFRTMTGVSPATPTLTVKHGAGSVSCSDPGILTDGEETEAVLDAEWAGAVAPGATLLFMSCGTTSGIFLSAEAVIDNNLATTMSLSYGNTEVGDQGDNTFFSNLWEQATAQGETVVVSAGDAGSANTDDQDQAYASHGLAVNGFASTAYNVAAGGTDFQDYYNQLEGDTAFDRAHYWNSSNSSGRSSAKSYVAETTWNDTCASSILSYYEESKNTDPNALCDTSQYLATGGGGGGVSIWQPRPSWQNGTVYGIPTTSTYNFRLLPDVSLFASNGFWSHALDYYESDTGGLQRAGGTSFVSPQLAGVFALIAQTTGERLGQPDYVLYNMAGVEYGTTSYTAGSTCNGSGEISGTGSNYGTTATVPGSTCIFYDVETSNISQACIAGSANCYTSTGESYGILSTSTTSAQVAYPAAEGFDLATGIGSLNIENLVNNWQTAASGGILYTPTVTVTAASASYTYGLPSAISYTATVSGPGSFPTGTVTFSGSPTISTIGNDPLVESSGCASGSTCTESATQAYTPSATLAAGSYTITGGYLSTNENYATGSGTTTLTVNKQTPTVTVTALTISFGTATSNFSATVSYVGSGVAPTGGLTFKVDTGTPVVATCTGTSSPLTCTYSNYSTSTLSIGTHTLTATTIADGNYAAATGSNNLIVLPLPTIVFTVPNHHTMDTPFSVSATSNSSGAITYSVVSGPATILGNSVTLTGVAGTVVLQASQAASASYGPGTQNASFLVIAGSVWFGNSTGSLSTFDLTGTAITSSGFTGGGVGTIASPLGLAFDSSGNIWVANSNGVSEFTRQGVAVTSTPYTVGGISSPLAIAVDGAGHVWVANGAGTVSELSNTGTAVSPSTGYSGPGSKPAGIAIDISGNVWVPSSTANTVTRILGVAAPVVPLATGAASGPGVEP
jgi:trimeric autotransporter adhesin